MSNPAQEETKEEVDEPERINVIDLIYKCIYIHDKGGQAHCWYAQHFNDESQEYAVKVFSN
jgi:hypothetical protein